MDNNTGCSKGPAKKNNELTGMRCRQYKHEWQYPVLFSEDITGQFLTT
jgi:hypothetical protein